MPGNDSLLKIKEAEAQADAIREQAVKDAQSLVSDAQRAAADRYSEALINAEEEKKLSLKKISDTSQAAADEERKDAVFEAERLSNRALRHRESAIRFICLEVKEKCQS